jgi:hypothetical protein
MDKNGNIIEPNHEYLSALVTCAVFFPPVCLFHLIAISGYRNRINVQSNLAQRKRKPSSALLHTKKSFKLLYHLIISSSSFPSNMIYLPSVQLFLPEWRLSNPFLVTSPDLPRNRQCLGSPDFSLSTRNDRKTYPYLHEGIPWHSNLLEYMRQILTVFIDFFSLTILFSLIEMTPAYYLVDGRMSNNPKVHVSCAWHDLERDGGEAWGRQLLLRSLKKDAWRSG